MKKSKNPINPLLQLLIVCYVFLATIGLFYGFLDSKMTFLNKCGTQSHLSILFPSYKLGCWLGSPISDSTNGRNE